MSYSLDDDFFFKDSADPVQRVIRPQCNVCGKLMIVLAKYCTNCGARIELRV